MSKLRLVSDCFLTNGLSLLSISWTLPYTHLADLSQGVEFAAVVCLVSGAALAFALALIGIARDRG